jgi:hypothetical protein
MTALTLINRHLNRNLATAFDQDFASPFWFKEYDDQNEKLFGFSSQMK